MGWAYKRERGRERETKRTALMDDPKEYTSHHIRARTHEHTNAQRRQMQGNRKVAFHQARSPLIVGALRYYEHSHSPDRGQNEKQGVCGCVCASPLGQRRNHRSTLYLTQKQKGIGSRGGGWQPCPLVRLFVYQRDLWNASFLQVPFAKRSRRFVTWSTLTLSPRTLGFKHGTTGSYVVAPLLLIVT